ncbi:MAG: hypothetical protein ACYS6K_14335, partial [Planctomycetota bacterium]
MLNHRNIKIIPTISLVMMISLALALLGCGNSDNMLNNDMALSSNHQTAILAQIMSEADVLLAPGKGGGKDFQNHWVNYDVLDELGGQLSCGPCKLEVPPGALSAPISIYMSATTDGVNTINYSFQPHGLEFLIPATLELSWSCLKHLTADDLILYYEQSPGVWVEETRGVW